MAAQSEEFNPRKPESRTATIEEEEEKQEQSDCDKDEEEEEEDDNSNGDDAFFGRKDWRFDIGVFNPESSSSSLEGSLKKYNLFGYGDYWNGSFTSNQHTTEMGIGVCFPKLKSLIMPAFARLYMLQQDWLKFSSYKNSSLGASIGLLSTTNHDLSYNLAWRTLMTDPSQMASSSIRRQLGHNLLSSLKYSYKVDHMNSCSRPTSGYCFASTTQVSGLNPDSRGLRFLRQDLDFRYAVPLGSSRAALNLGVSGGAIFPWGSGGFLGKPSSVADRFFMGGPNSMLGFKFRGIGPMDLRRQTKNTNHNNLERDAIGGDLALNAFVDLSFDLPFKKMREAGIYGRAIASAGSLTTLSENKFRDFSLQKFYQSVRSYVGFGVTIPTKLFKLEVNYCHILKESEHDKGKTGLQFSFSSPS
ncbi:hypothetical protein V2J09_012535 [Rumex salicifolius]